MKNKTLTLYSAQVKIGGEEALFSLLPPDSIKKVMSRRGNRASTALGELIRLHMMRVCGAPDEVAARTHGKPYVPSRPDVGFSISHSGRLAVGALLLGDAGDKCEVGVDVESIDRENDSRRRRIADRFYTEAERRRIAYADDKAAEFYLIWTRKEAVIKYTGEGLSRALSDVDTAEPESIESVFGCRIYSRIIRDTSGTEYAFSVSVPSGIDADNIDITKIY